MALSNGCGSGVAHQDNGWDQANQVAKLVFSLSETIRLAVTCRQQIHSHASDISQFGLHLIRLRWNLVVDPLLFRQLCHWPYVVDSVRGSGSPVCPYTRMDVYVRPLRNQADFTLEVEIFQKEAWQNQICCQNILATIAILHWWLSCQGLMQQGRSAMPRGRILCRRSLHPGLEGGRCRRSGQSFCHDKYSRTCLCPKWMGDLCMPVRQDHVGSPWSWQARTRIHMDSATNAFLGKRTSRRNGIERGSS